ncbi:CAP domain-containing protein [Cronbergia sp. UHCC 0137]|uniref:CAP domain-containing protein n=1 Tax=Cronbergia sp. UHCC 0137 TaxID=3110239 RepID=UPI002B20DD03|nr:CAP domain-containing protein [Cronbergia sp. UHCC 0137]MEA5618449.1 CAP domain-containing protein [Cronbergia sp. UHCC 0137]
MLRQTAFGIALSMVVLASGFVTAPKPGNSYTQKSPQNQQSLNSFSQAATSNPTFQTSTLEKSVFEKVNQYRVNQGLQKLTLNPNITRQARIHSQNMAKGKVPFSHQGFEQRVKAIPLTYNSASENLAFNIGYTNPANEAIIGWLNSPVHLKNIQGHYNLTGIGVATNRKGEVYLTQIFLKTK